MDYISDDETLALVKDLRDAEIKHQKLVKEQKALKALLDRWLHDTGALLPTVNPDWAELCPEGCGPHV